MMAIANMSRYFGVEYYKGLILPSNPTKEAKAAMAVLVKDQNKLIRDTAFCCAGDTAPLPGERRFSLWTTYPGLMMGTGYPHDGGLEGDICAGFSFDYVTGLPYLPGSSVKGVLRSAFTHPDYIRELMADDQADVWALEHALFGKRPQEETQEIPDGKVVFLDAFPVGSKDAETDDAGIKRYRLLELENITPHHQDETHGLLTEPNPLTFVKVRPGVEFRFRFLMPEKICYGTEASIAADTVVKLFSQIFLDLGAGAKTNVGFGSFTDENPGASKTGEKPAAKNPDPGKTGGKPAAKKPGVCNSCGKKTALDKETGKSQPFCGECWRKYMLEESARNSKKGKKKQ